MARFRVVPDESTVDIDLDVNLHPSHLTAGAVSGTIECELDGSGRPRLDAPYAARLSLRVDQLTSGNGLQDREMRRRFDARRHPTIVARVTHGEELDGRGRYRASAQLTMHGQTREVEAVVRVRAAGNRLVVDGRQSIDVRDFGIEPPRLLVLRVGPVVKVRAHMVAEQR